MLVFYIVRAGRKLPASCQRILEKAKIELRGLLDGLGLNACHLITIVVFANWRRLVWLWPEFEDSGHLLETNNIWGPARPKHQLLMAISWMLFSKDRRDASGDVWGWSLSPRSA